MPVYDKRAAMRVKRPATGPQSPRHRKIELLHLSYGVILEDWNRKTLNAQRLRWANGRFRWSLLILAMYLADQPEHDAILCEGPSTCKRCTCPKGRLHETTLRYPPRQAAADRSLVYRAAFGGELPAYARKPHKPGASERRIAIGRDLRRRAVGAAPVHLFQPITSGDGRSRWIPTTDCTPAIYEDVKVSALGGMHIIKNAFWDVVHDVNIRDLSVKDPLHCMDHGVSELIMKCTIQRLRDLEVSLGLHRHTLVNQFLSRLRIICHHDTHQVSLLRFKRSDVMDYVENLAGIRDASQKSHAVCDATDMHRLTLVVPFVLDGLADAEILQHNSGVPRAADRITNPIPEMIACWNDYLRWYHLYRQGENNELALDRLDATGVALLEDLKRIFPYCNDDGSSLWCTEKVHNAFLHAKDNIKRSGRCRNLSTQVTEMKHKGMKDQALLSNNHHTLGLSILRAAAKADAAACLASHQAALGNLDRLEGELFQISSL